MLQTASRPDATFDPAIDDAAGVARRAVVASLALTASLLVLGGFGQLVVFDSWLGNAEADLVRWVSEHRVGVLDSAATIGSTLTDTWTVIGVLVGSVAILLAVGHTRLAVLMVIGVGLELTTFLVVGAIVERPRPEVETLHSVPSTPSFPSGHAAAAVVLYSSLVLVVRMVAVPGRVPRTLWIAPVLATVIVATSRVYEGVHYPTDVAAGAVLGMGALYGAMFAVGLPGRRDNG